MKPKNNIVSGKLNTIKFNIMLVSTTNPTISKAAKVSQAAKVSSKNSHLLQQIGTELHVGQGVTAEKLIRLLTPLQVAKKDLKNAVNDKRNSLTYNLNLIKNECRANADNYINELNTKFALKIEATELFELVSKPSNFIPFLTESQLVKFSEHKLNFTPSLIIEAIAKYFKATAKGLK